MSESLTNKLPGAGVQTSYVHSSLKSTLFAVSLQVVPFDVHLHYIDNAFICIA